MRRADAALAPAGAAAPARADWLCCPGCRTLLYVRRFERDLRVCARCGHHARLTAQQRLDTLLDRGLPVPLDVTPAAFDPLAFVDTVAYTDRLAQARAMSGLAEAVTCVRGRIDGEPVVLAVMDFRFMGGSLGSAAGELITLAAETALAERTPLVLVTASGGARMHEGVLALMQMAKTTQALAQLDEAGVLTVSVLTDPTYGGVAASFATQADVILAEPGARMGFAGPRVIEQTILQELPDGFQTAEFLLARGLIDGITPRSALRATLAQLLRHRGTAAPRPPTAEAVVITDPDALPESDAWQAVRAARHVDRPTTLDFVHAMLDCFVPLHGDRLAADCPAVVGGLGWLDGVPLVLVGHQKGHTSQERAAHNFGMASPEGYRKAARLMALAAKLGLPVVTLIDTPGAHPGLAAEEGGQALAIAENLRLMSSLRVPIVTVITGEGGSGGALALGVSDRIYALSNAVYSVISPEGCASILWKDAALAPRAAEALRLGVRELLRLGVIDAVVPEPAGGAHREPAAMAEILRGVLSTALAELAGWEHGQLVRARRERFRGFGAESCVSLRTSARG